MESLAGLKSLSPSLKSKAWTGLRKSSTETAGVAFAFSIFLGFPVDFLAGVGFFTGAGFLAGVGFLAVFLERLETSPSIDLFFSIVYNYSIWELN